MSAYMMIIIRYIRSIPVLIALLACLPFLVGKGQTTFFELHRGIIDEVGMGLLAKSPTKSTIDLNGSWQYRENEDDPWREVAIPASYEGDRKFTFRRDFTVDPKLVHHSIFQFYALNIAGYCEIYVNDHFVGKHTGETSFGFKITPGIIRSGSNTISINVHNFLNINETIPLPEQLRSKKNYGGIVSDIAIIASGPVWVQESNIHADFSGEGRNGNISYQVILSSGQFTRMKSDSLGKALLSGKLNIDHYFEVFDPGTGQLLARSETRRVAVEADRAVLVEMRLDMSNVNLWSPESPFLYLIRQRTMLGGMLIDESYQQIGFRSFSIRESEFMLNGSPIFLHGVTYIEDSPFHGRSLSLDEMDRDVLLMKNLGANAVRIMSGTVHPYFLSLCDKYGLLVFQDLCIELPSPIVLGKPGLQLTAINNLREMVSRDNNHPSVVAWGIAQGVNGKMLGLESFFRNVVKNFQQGKKQLFFMSFSIPPTSAESDLFDFIAIDIFPSSKKQVVDLFDVLAQDRYEKPVLIGSLTYPVQIGNYNGHSDPRSIDAQGQFYLEIYSEILQRKFSGVFVHAFADWAVSQPLASSDLIQQFLSTAGIVDRFRQKRLAYDILKAKFNNEKPPIVSAGNYSEEHPATFVVFGILILLVFAVVYNLFRRFRENVLRSFLRPFNFYSDVRDQRMLSIFQTTVIGTIGSFSAALVLANIMYFYRMNFFYDIVVSLFIKTVWLKQWLNFAAWNPLSNIAVMAVLLFLVLLLYSFALKAVAFFSKKHLLLFDAYSVAMWSVLPMAFLAPFGTILNRLMGIPALSIITLLVFFGFNIWVISRLLKGTAIVLDVRPVFFYFAGFVLLFAALFTWLLSMDTQYETFSYLQFYFRIWSNLHFPGT
jgi:hypothetical protein